MRGIASRRLLALPSFTTPTTSMSMTLSRANPKRLPSGLSLPQKYFASVSFTIATFGAPCRVARVEVAAGQQRHAQRLEEGRARPR